MITTSFYLDSRRAKANRLFPLKIVLSKRGKRAMIPTGIDLLPSQWENGQIVNHPNKTVLQAYITNKKASIEKTIIEFTLTGKIVGLEISEIAKLVQEQLDPELLLKKQKEESEKRNFCKHYYQYYSDIENAGTQKLYSWTLSKIYEYCGLKNINTESLEFENINKKWLEDFEKYCLQTEKQNTVAIHLRNIRTVFNDAIDEEITTCYPFRKFKILTEESRDKSYTSKELRAFFDYKCYDGLEQEALDIFKLMFCLIGINCIDLAYLDNNGKDRIEYYRAKTHKFYSIKIEKEALEIIQKYKGSEHLLNILERCPNYKTYFNRIGKTLRKIGKIRVAGKKSIGKAILPEVCTGSARTSWATIAQEELNIPREVIAAALGHHTVDVTTTYLRTDWKKKVDEANRKVLDLVFNG